VPTPLIKFEIAGSRWLHDHAQPIFEPAVEGAFAISWSVATLALSLFFRLFCVRRQQTNALAQVARTKTHKDCLTTLSR
jgi:hypothetical protein